MHAVHGPAKLPVRRSRAVVPGDTNCGVVVPDQAVVEAIVGELGQVPKSLVAAMEADLCKLINRHPFIQVRCSPAANLAVAGSIAC